MSVWITNAKETEAIKLIEKIDFAFRGAPKASERYSVKELKEMKLIGIYKPDPKSVIK